MVSIDDRPDDAAMRVHGAWEGDLIMGQGNKSAAATLVERNSRFVIILGLPDGKQSEGLADVLIDRFNDLPRHLRGSLTWDQGTEMANHAKLTIATDLPVYFAHPRSPWERPTNENTNGLIREYLPKGVEIPSNQLYLYAIADELNDNPTKPSDSTPPEKSWKTTPQQGSCFHGLTPPRPGFEIEANGVAFQHWLIPVR